MINYAFLWNYEYRKGQIEGLKDRPCVVVSVSQEARGLNIVVCPLTSQTPEAQTTLIELPQRVKNFLGLTDREKTFAVTSEVNIFTWPGPDLRPFDKEGKRDVYFGKIPERLHSQIKEGVLSHAKSHRLKTTPRD